MIFSSRHAMPLSGKTSLEKARQTHDLTSGGRSLSNPSAPCHVRVRLGKAWLGLANTPLLTGSGSLRRGSARQCVAGQCAVRLDRAMSGPAMRGMANTLLPTRSRSLQRLGAARFGWAGHGKHTASHGMSKFVGPCQGTAGPCEMRRGKHTASAWGVAVCLSLLGRAGLGPAGQTHGVSRGVAVCMAKLGVSPFGMSPQDGPWPSSAGQRNHNSGAPESVFQPTTL